MVKILKNYMRLVGFVAFITSSTLSLASETEFRYSGDIGPGFWGELNAEWDNCSTDTSQSPVDIKGSVSDNSLTALELVLEEIPIDIINNGHTLEQEYEPGSTLILNGKVFTLLQFHFHTPSEHTVDDIRYDMELHAVFKEVDGTALAVIAQFFIQGNENSELSLIADHLPQQAGEEFHPSTGEINLAHLLVDTSKYYTLNGSLTTPPCSPIVTWIILKTASEMSEQQFQSFRQVLGNNIRPLQELHGRTIRATE